MIKSDLLKLIETVADDGDINDLLLSNEEFKPKEIDVEAFKSLLASNKEIKAYYQSALDSGISKGVTKFEENFTTNKLPKLIEEGIKAKSDEGLTDEQKQLRELTAKLETMEKEKARAERMAKFKDVATEKKIPSKLLDYLLTDDDDSTNSNLDLFQTSMKEYVEAEVKERLKGGEYKPPKNEGQPGAITKEQFSKMTYKERLEIYNTNKGLYDELNKQE